MKKRTIIGVIVARVVIAGGLAVLQSASRPGHYAEQYDEELSGEYMRAPEGVPAPQERSLPEQKVIKTSLMSLEVEDFQTAADEIGLIASRYGGHVADFSAQNIKDRTIGTITVRVPEDTFEEVIKEIEKVGDLKGENITLEDVTEQYIDLTARLENLKHQEQRYLEILDMAVTVEDVLKVETQLERIRGDIESMQGRLIYLDNRVSLSTIQIQLSEPEIIAHESGIKKAFNDAIDGFLSAVRGIIIFMGYFIPVAVFLTVAAVLGRFIYLKLSKEH